MFQRMAHRLAGDLDQSAERLVQFEEQEDRGAHGHRRRHERRNRGAVARREEAEAEEKDREPEHHYDQERLGNGRACLLEKQPIHLAKLNGDLQGLGLRRTLCVGLWRQFLDGASGPQLASTRSRKANFAAIWMSWFLCASYEPLAEATSNPRTRAVIVATRPMASFTVSLVSALR